jgi:acyl-coenzyme A thioesterase PaaI-like protein
MSMPSSKKIVYDEPENRCFGCSPHNEHGLRLVFYEKEPGLVEAPLSAAPRHDGAPGVIHGGIQAAALDEVLGAAIHSGLGGRDVEIVTVDFQLRYRRPAPSAAPLTVRARYLRQEGRKYYAEGEIVAEDGEVLTRADACWYRI